MMNTKTRVILNDGLAFTTEHAKDSPGYRYDLARAVFARVCDEIAAFEKFRAALTGSYLVRCPSLCPDSYYVYALDKTSPSGKRNTACFQVCPISTQAVSQAKACLVSPTEGLR